MNDLLSLVQPRLPLAAQRIVTASTVAYHPPQPNWMWPPEDPRLASETHAEILATLDRLAREEEE